jgi:hypothetical protein
MMGRKKPHRDGKRKMEEKQIPHPYLQMKSLMHLVAPLMLMMEDRASQVLYEASYLDKMTRKIECYTNKTCREEISNEISFCPLERTEDADQPLPLDQIKKRLQNLRSAKNALDLMFITLFLVFNTFKCWRRLCFS